MLVLGGMSLALAVTCVHSVNVYRKAELTQQLDQRMLGIAVALRAELTELIQRIDQPTTSELHSGPPSGGRAELQLLADRVAVETVTRISVIDSAGEVLADSNHDPIVMLNHANREEIVEARRTGVGKTSRISPKLQVSMQYLAIQVPVEGNDPAFVRVAIRTEALDRRLASVAGRLWMLALGLWSLAAIVTWGIVNREFGMIARLTEQARSIALDADPPPLAVPNNVEVGQLTKSFNQMQARVDDRMRQLRVNSHQMSTVLGSMDEGIIAVDADQRIVLANDASKSLLSFSTSDEVGRPLLEAVRNRALYDVVRKCLESGSPVQTQFESKQEPRRELSVRATCLPGDPANGVVMVLQDVTELRRLENLRQEFVANVSHELKTPLASIKAYAETLRLGAMDDPANNLRFIDRIEEQAERLHQLIMDMLQIARVESGEEAFDITVVDVQSVVDSCYLRHVENAHHKEVTLLVDAPEMPLAVLADEDGLDTILDNLISNAIKYTPECGRITIRWFDDGDFVEMTVQDTGVGIAEEHHTRVFERFYRADKARSRLLGGTGLGLSIVKHLAQSFNGSVALTSRVGEGTTFRVRLPKSDSA